MAESQASPNLQILLDAGVVKQQTIAKFSEEQVAKIEELDPGQVQTLIDVYNRVGEVVGVWLI